MKFAVTGTQNTGKSTFVTDFIAAFPSFMTPAKTYRDVIKDNDLAVNQLTGLESQRLIRDFMYTQIMEAPDNTIFDRCLIDNYIYTRYAYEKGNVPESFLKETERLMYETCAVIDHFFFIPSAVSIPLVQDSLRDIDLLYVDTVNRLFIEITLELVRALGIKVKVLSGDRNMRIEQVRPLVSLKESLWQEPVR